MTRYDFRTRLLASGLAALAGYVDAVGFLGTGGFFVSFMSGNSTRLGVGVARSAEFAVAALALIGAFVAGVMIASAITQKAVDRRPGAVMLLVSVSLALSAAIAPLAPPLATFACVAFAMGAENLVFEADGEVRIGLTYMTGTLVKIGQRLSIALAGGDRWGWLPFFLLWLGLIAGGVIGALAYALLGVGSLWIAAGAAALLTPIVHRLAGDRRPVPAR